MEADVQVVDLLAVESVEDGVVEGEEDYLDVAEVQENLWGPHYPGAVQILGDPRADPRVPHSRGVRVILGGCRDPLHMAATKTQGDRRRIEGRAHFNRALTAVVQRLDVGIL